MKLAELQRALLASLTGSDPPPAGCNAQQIARARRGLILKRTRAAEHLLPSLREALGGDWFGTFAAHARNYTAVGMLYHVDDAWMFALVQQRYGFPRIVEAARVDLARLAQRYIRSEKLGAVRIRERRRLADVVRHWLGLVTGN